MKTGDFEFRAPLMSHKELGFMFCSVYYKGKKFMSLDIPFFGRNYLRRVTPFPVDDCPSLELFIKLMEMLPAKPEQETADGNEIDSESWLVALVNAWLRMERKADRLFRKYPDADMAAIALDEYRIPVDTCVLSEGFSKAEAIGALKRIVSDPTESFSYVLINKEKGFDFPAWPVPALLGWD